MSSDTSLPYPKGFRRFQLEVLLSTWVAYFGLYFCRKTFAVVKATLEVDFNLTSTNLGDIDGFYLMAYAVGQFVSAGLGAKVGPRLLLLLGIAVSIACNIAFAFSDNMATFSIFMIVNGLAQSAGWPACIGTLASWIRREERGSIMGVWATCYQVGGLAATTWAAFWLKSNGVKGAFLASSAFVCGVWLIVFIFQRNRPEDRELPPIPDGEFEEKALSDDKEDTSAGWTRDLVLNVIIVGIFYFGVKFIRYALQGWLPYFLQKNFGLAGDDAGYLSTIFEAAGIFGALSAGFISDYLFRGKRTPVALVMLGGMTIGTIGLYLSANIGLTFFAVSIGLVGFMLYGPDSLLTGAGAMDVGNKKTALVAAGIINGIGAIGATVQTFIIGRIYEQMNGNLAPIFALLIIASFASMLAVAILLFRARKGISSI
ncbi:MAG: MFS transporter [Deltaproteobacteria bacterium]|nr:MFS transporter [Deltaproteobacteria bacterium]